MCGITAVIQLHQNAVLKRTQRSKLISEVERSLDKIRHRGPDDRGVWISKDENVALGHVRLAIKDLTPTGSQPLSNSKGTVHAIVNGEFYEYSKLFTQLSKDGASSYDFQSSSDSELLIALYERDGLNLFPYLRGEFSFVLYDSERQILLAARDRLGIKPLFWTISGGRLLIASEAKALLPLGWQPQWDVRSVVEDGWLHDERTLFRGVRKVMPGHYMTCYSFDTIQTRPYWEAEFPDKNEKDPRTEHEMITQLRQQLYEAVSVRIQGDCPVGVYLSGGIDSAIVAGILADVLRNRERDGEQSSSTLCCFSVGFEEGTEFDEMPLAERTAKHIGAKFIGQRLDESILAENFEKATIASEHHNPDLNSAAKFLLSKLVADNGIKVVLSGEGSDEHFAGYSQFIPDAIREPDLTTEDYNKMSIIRREQLVAQVEARTTPGYKGVPQGFAQTPTKFARRMLNNSYISASLWALTVAPFASWTKEIGRMSVPETRAISAGARFLDRINSIWHPLHSAQYIWTRSILPNFILTSLGDRMEMANSIEGRTPFLDHHLATFANNLPPSTKVHFDVEGGTYTEKWILREAAKPYITKEMYERKKHPFSAPLKYNIGGPLHNVLSRLVTRENLLRLGFVDVEEGLRMINQAFTEQDGGAFRATIVLAQWVALSKEFGVPAATPENSPQLSKLVAKVGIRSHHEKMEHVFKSWMWRIGQRTTECVRMLY